MTKKDFSLSDISVREDVKLIVRLKSATFARTLLFLKLKFDDDDDFLYTSELQRFLKTSQSHAFNLLTDLFHPYYTYVLYLYKCF